MSQIELIQTLRETHPLPSRKLDLPPDVFSSIQLTKINAFFNRAEILKYGMSYADFAAILHQDNLQNSFESKFGISYASYLTRMQENEMMGESLCMGKFVPPGS